MTFKDFFGDLGYFLAWFSAWQVVESILELGKHAARILWPGAGI